MKYFLPDTARTMTSQFRSVIPSISEIKDFFSETKIEDAYDHFSQEIASDGG